MHAIASYYRCDVCRNVWTYPKGQELTAPPRMVTSFPDRERHTELGLTEPSSS